MWRWHYQDTKMVPESFICWFCQYLHCQLNSIPFARQSKIINLCICKIPCVNYIVLTDFVCINIVKKKTWIVLVHLLYILCLYVRLTRIFIYDWCWYGNNNVRNHKGEMILCRKYTCGFHSVLSFLLMDIMVCVLMLFQFSGAGDVNQFRCMVVPVFSLHKMIYCMSTALSLKFA